MIGTSGTRCDTRPGRKPTTRKQSCSGVCIGCHRVRLGQRVKTNNDRYAPRLAIVLTMAQQTVGMDPGIVCFQHCGPKIFCFSLPQFCPACQDDLGDANFALLPFRVPYPFIRASQYPCAVVIKPTTGDFLNDYYNSMDLHIGVTTSTGTIVEFDGNGLRRHRMDEWEQCLLLDQAPSPWIEHWDNTLLQVCRQKCWSPKSYSEHKHNCYNFVLTFLVSLKYGSLSAAAANRTAFCEKFIVPRTTAAGKYISLYRKLKEFGFYVHRSAHK